MKFMKRSQVYKASNVQFDPKKIEAFSYGWWKFVGLIDGRVVFNNYNYSNSTIKHQYKTRKLMNDLGIKIDIEMPLRSGLPGTYIRHDQNLSYQTLDECILEAETQICNNFLSDIIKKQDKYYSRKAKIQKFRELQLVK